MRQVCAGLPSWRRAASARPAPQSYSVRGVAATENGRSSRALGRPNKLQKGIWPRNSQKVSFHIRKLIAGHKGSWQAKKSPKRDLATKQPESVIPYQEVSSGTRGLWAGQKRPKKGVGQRIFRFRLCRKKLTVSCARS